MNHKRLGEVVARERRLRGWTLRDMAERCGVRHGTIQYIESSSGSKDPELSTLNKFAHVFAAEPLRFGPQTVEEYMSFLLEAAGYPTAPATSRDEARLRDLREKLAHVPNGDDLIERLVQASPALQRQIANIAASLVDAERADDPLPPAHPRPRTRQSVQDQTAPKSKPPQRRDGHSQRG